MKKLSLIFIIFALFLKQVEGQELNQTVRGTITDADSKMPLIGSTVSVAGTTPVIGTTTDVNGNFRLENIPIGRITLQFSYLGYEGKTIPNITVNSAKEVVLEITMRESAVVVDEVVVKANKNKGNNNQSSPTKTKPQHN